MTDIVRLKADDSRAADIIKNWLRNTVTIDDIVVTNTLEATGAMPTVDIGYGIVATRGGGGTMDDDLGDFSHRKYFLAMNKMMARRRAIQPLRKAAFIPARKPGEGGTTHELAGEGDHYATGDEAVFDIGIGSGHGSGCAEEAADGEAGQGEIVPFEMA